MTASLSSFPREQTPNTGRGKGRDYIRKQREAMLNNPLGLSLRTFGKGRGPTAFCGLALSLSHSLSQSHTSHALQSSFPYPSFAYSCAVAHARAQACKDRVFASSCALWCGCDRGLLLLCLEAGLRVALLLLAAHELHGVRSETVSNGW